MSERSWVFYLKKGEFWKLSSESDVSDPENLQDNFKEKSQLEMIKL